MKIEAAFLPGRDAALRSHLDFGHFHAAQVAIPKGLQALSPRLGDAKQTLPWVCAPQKWRTLKGFQHWEQRLGGLNPFRVRWNFNLLPRVARSSQPWAERFQSRWDWRDAGRKMSKLHRTPRKRNKLQAARFAGSAVPNF